MNRPLLALIHKKGGIAMRYAILILIVIVLLSTGCENKTANKQGEGLPDVSGSGQGIQNESMSAGDQAVQNDETVGDSSAGSQGIQDEKTLMIGSWHTAPYVGAAYGPRYHFYDDGSYLYESSNYTSENRIISESGTWNIENEILTLTVNSKVTVEGGERVKQTLPDDPSQYMIVNGTVKIIEVNPPEKENYDLGAILKDTIEDGNGFLTTTFNGDQYWKLSDDPDALHNDFVFNDGDIWNPAQN